MKSYGLSCGGYDLGIEIELESRETWDEWFIALSRFIATRSKDPSTKVGAVIVRPDRTIASTGYNGFPRGIEDKAELLNDRPEKYKRVIHAEMNAVLTAKEPLTGYTLYCSLFSCGDCAKHIIQSGISTVVAPKELSEARWGDSHKLALAMYHEAGVKVLLL